MASKKKQNFEKKRKKKHVSSTSTENINEFTLQNVVGLGGDEADYELLKNVDDEDDVVTDGIVANEQNEVKKSEVQNLIKELGLQSLKNQSNLKVKQVNNHDDTVNSKKTKTKTKESTKSKRKANNKATPTERAQSPGNASERVGDVEIKDRLLIHPVGRWFEE
ncbi:Hypothetical predicted protein, partial [Paramuricea clavata]